MIPVVISDTSRVTADHISGGSLFGDDFTEAEIRQWFSEERLGYFALKTDADADADAYEYEYDVVNSVYGFPELRDRYQRCVALGCARGDDILPVADRIGEIIAVEPAEPWWSDHIGNTPATYVMPQISGRLDLADSSVDLVTAFGVLHHIPNVSAVIAELGRVCMPGATVILREPSHAMGDFRVPRSGLTKNERGIDPEWMVRTAASCGFKLKRLVHYDLGVFAKILKRFGLRVHGSKVLLAADRLICRMLVWNHRYWRTNAWQKLAPSAALYHFEKV